MVRSAVPFSRSQSDNPIVKLGEQHLHLRHQQVRVVPGIDDDRDALGIALKILSLARLVEADEELGRSR